MLVSLGQNTKSPDDIVDALLECHQRIRRFTALTLTVGSRPGPTTVEIQDACAQIERYFRQALPLHVQDEEETVLPRLRGLRADVDQAMATMKGEHEEHGPLLVRLFAALAQQDPLALLEAGTALNKAFTDHLAKEEAVIFPALRQWVPVEVRRAMLGELRGRRQ